MAHNNMHLTLEQRKVIEQMLNNNFKLKEIAYEIDKDERTVSKEIRKRLFLIPNKHIGVSKEVIKNHDSCPKLMKFPYCCNGCIKRPVCTFTRFYYIADKAQIMYEKILATSRSGIKMSKVQFEEMDEILKDGVSRGLSPFAIYSMFPEKFNCSLKTIYNYIDKGILQTRNADLRRKVKYKVRKQYSQPMNSKQKENLIGRKIEDYFHFVAEHRVICPVQMDTVLGSRNSKKCFLTLHFVPFHFMLVYLLKEKTTNEVKQAFDYIQYLIGIDDFKKLFPCVLTDRGPEFLEPQSLEMDDETGEIRTRIFYCDAYVSNQKAQIESNHRLIRYILPKGSYLDVLNDNDASIITNHIASYPRKELGGGTPYNMFSRFYPEITKKLRIKKVDPNMINLSPTLLHNK